MAAQHTLFGAPEDVQPVPAPEPVAGPAPRPARRRFEQQGLDAYTHAQDGGRNAERADVLAFLREFEDRCERAGMVFPSELIAAIERGDHVK